MSPAWPASHSILIINMITFFLTPQPGHSSSFLAGTRSNNLFHTTELQCKARSNVRFPRAIPISSVTHRQHRRQLYITAFYFPIKKDITEIIHSVAEYIYIIINLYDVLTLNQINNTRMILLLKISLLYYLNYI